MKISFIIPAYNEQILLPICLESLKKEIERNTNVHIEVIVVNNASTDNTRKEAENFSFVKIIDENKKGLVYARQAGYENSTGELLANIDSDTILPFGWIHTVLKEFKKDNNLVAMSGPYIYYDLNIFQRLLVKIFYFFGYIFYLINHFLFNKGAMLQGGNFILKRSALVSANGFDTTIKFYGEDTDIAKRISKFGKVLWTFRLPMYTSGRRLLDEGLIKTGITYALNFFWISFFNVPYTQKHTDVRITK